MVGDYTDILLCHVSPSPCAINKSYPYRRIFFKLSSNVLLTQQCAEPMLSFSMRKLKVTFEGQVPSTILQTAGLFLYKGQKQINTSIFINVVLNVFFLSSITCKINIVLYC